MGTKHTLISPAHENIGQVRIENAFEEIIRLNKQEETNSWRVDFSHFMFVPDETETDVSNPCPLRYGYVWVTKTRELSSVEKAATELLEALMEIKRLYGDRTDYIGEYKNAWGQAENAIKKATE